MRSQSCFFRRDCRWMLAVAILLLSVVAGSAQSTGRLSGIVDDATGAVLPGVDVTARNEATGLEYTTVSSSEGVFNFPDLPIGMYQVTAVLPGFKTAVTPGVQIVTGRTRDVRVRLEIGEISEQVQVVGGVPVVHTTSAEVQTTIQAREIEELPLSERNPLQLVILTPGTRFTSVGTHSGQQDNPGVTVQGLRATDNNYLVDGSGYVNLQAGSAPTLPNPDTLQEFTVKSSNFSAEFSRAGALVQLSTRSGTNRFRGALFHYLRNDVLDARPFFAPERPAFKRNQYGATFGGPIKRDRTFFFGSFQGTNSRGGPTPRNVTVPTMAMRGGDFTGTGRTIIDPATGAPFPGNIIPQDRFDPLAVKLLAAMPPPLPGRNTAQLARQVDLNDYQYLVRIDHKISDSNNLSARYFRDDQEFQRDTNSYTGNYALNTFDNQLFSVSDTHSFSPTFTWTNSVGYSRTYRDQIPVFPFSPQSLGANVPLANAVSSEELRIQMTGYTQFFSGGPLQYYPQNLEVKSHAAWALSSGMLQFGVDISRGKQFSVDASQGGGQWQFSGDRTRSLQVANSGNAIADLLLGLPRSFQQLATPALDFRENKFALWVQNDRKLRRDLTLNLGLRWEPWLVPYDALGPWGGFAPGVQSTVAPTAPVGLIFGGNGVSDIAGRDQLLKSDWNNFAPRLGLAWDVGGRGATVVRAGYGLFYRAVPFNIWRESAKQVPFRALFFQVLNPPSTANPFGASTSPFPYEEPSLDTIKTYQFRLPLAGELVDPDITTGYTQSWNLTIEQRLTQDMSVSLAYVGNRSIRVLEGIDANPAVYAPGATLGNIQQRRVYPDFGRLLVYTDHYENATYNALQLSLNRRSRSGLNVMANYTFGKALDMHSGTLGGAGTRVRNPFDPGLDKGPADYDVTHEFKLSFIYPLPGVAPDRRLLAGFLNGWQLNSITNVRSGLPLTVKAGIDYSLSDVRLDNADQIGAPKPDNPTPQVYLNRSSFQAPAAGTFGTLGRNSIRGPGSTEVDLSLYKNFAITEDMRFQIRIEAFNAFNNVNFNNPAATLSGANFGTISATSAPRVMQIGLRLSF